MLRLLNLRAMSHFACLFIAAMAALAFAKPCVAIPLALPPVGAAVNYDFQAEQPVFFIAEGASSSEILYNRIRFSGNRLIRADGTFVVVTITLRGEGIADLMEPIWIRFDEIMSLDSADDSFFALEKNGSVTADNSGDHYGFSWDFAISPGSKIRGVTWNITPDLVPRALLPAQLDLEMYMWSDGPIVVVPEPSSVATILTAIAVVGCRRGRPRFAA